MKKLFLLSIMMLSMLIGAQTFTISTLSGIGTQTYSGDGGLAALAGLSSPRAVAVDAAGNVYIADTYNHRIRKISTNGVITTIAGIGTTGFSGDGGLATAAQLHGPWGIAVDAAGNIFIADRYNQRIRKINTSGIINTIAGTGVVGYGGDGGVATAALFNDPFDVAVDAAGNVFIADNLNCRIRKINTNGIISNFAGNGGAGFTGDGGQANVATLNFPWGVTVDQFGNVFIADNTNARLRKVNTSGVISTIAGNGGSGTSGDGGAATAAQIGYICSVVVDAAGNLYVADANNNRLRKINTSGIISTVAGTTAGFSGDGGLATAAQLNSPRGLGVDGIGNIYVADSWNNRIRKLTAACLAYNISASSGTLCQGQTFTMALSGANSYSINGTATTAFTVNPSNTTTFTIRGYQLGCVSNTVVATVSVSPIPIISASSGSICAGSVYSMNLTGANSYSVNGSASSFTFSPAITTTFAVNGSSLGCLSSNTIVATVSVVPLPSISVSSGSICQGNTFTMVLAGASTYSINGVSVVSYTLNPVNTSTYLVNGKSLGCVSAGIVTTVTVKPLPSISIQSLNVICKTETAVLAANGALTYTWNTNQNLQTINVSPTVTTSYTVSGFDVNSCKGQAMITVSVNACTGIEESKNEKFSFKIYPNPGNGFLIVEGGEGRDLKIMNAIGQLVHEQTLPNNATNVSLLDFPSGIYFFNIGDAENYQVLKFVKQ